MFIVDRMITFTRMSHAHQSADCLVMAVPQELDEPYESRYVTVPLSEVLSNTLPYQSLPNGAYLFKMLLPGGFSRYVSVIPRHDGDWVDVELGGTTPKDVAPSTDDDWVVVSADTKKNKYNVVYCNR